MKVVDIINSEIVLHSVPDNYKRCSVSGTFCDPSEFMREDIQVRTNSHRTYMLPTAEFTALSAETKRIMQSPEFKRAVIKLEKDLALYCNSLSAQELIEKLQQLPLGSRLLVTQEGYYAEGEFGSIFSPELHKTNEEGISFYSIGHSSQNY